MNKKTQIKEKARKIAMKIAELGKQHGAGFAVYAIAANILDEVVIPAVFLYLGYPAISGLSLLGDLDWLTYPLYFVIINGWRKVNLMINLNGGGVQ